MEISWENEALWKLFHNKTRAKRKLGPRSAEMLDTRWHELVNAPNVLELVAGFPHPISGLKGKYAYLEGQYSLRLAEGKRLVFRPDHDPVPKKETGETDWEKDTSVTITYIGNYHHG